MWRSVFQVELASNKKEELLLDKGGGKLRTAVGGCAAEGDSADVITTLVSGSTPTLFDEQQENIRKNTALQPNNRYGIF